MIWYVYIVRCRDGALYTGITTDVDLRVKVHNSGKGSRSVVAHGTPVTLTYVEEVGSHSAALKREIEIKKMAKREKEKLVTQQVDGQVQL